MDALPPRLLPLGAMARQLGLRPTWLKAEAEGGRVPCLVADRLLLFNPDVVERLLAERAGQERLPPKGVRHAG
jgi:hypothetical protein